MKSTYFGSGFLSLAPLILLLGCRGEPSSQPPVHLNQNMDFTTMFKPQEENPFFADGRSMRMPVPGTVARGHLKENSTLHEGKQEGKYVEKVPFPITRSFLERGRERYQIYCAPCHDLAGTADGIVVRKGMLKPPSFHDPRIVKMPVGEIYNAIVEGVRGNMPSYAYAIPLDDRWAIVGYVRALQFSQRASLDNVPSDVANSNGWR